MDFLKTVGNSIHNPKFYSAVPQKNFKQAFGYFFLLILLLTIINLLTVIGPIFGKTTPAIKNVVQNLINCVPTNLEINITHGQASINQKEPYFLPECDKDWKNSSVVVDTKTPYSPSKFTEYSASASAWVTKDSIVYKKNNFETRTYSFAKIEDFKFNRQSLESLKTKYEPYLKYVAPVLLILAFLGIFLSYLIRLIYLFFMALLIWLLAKTLKKDLPYSLSYKIGLYAITLGLIVDIVLRLTSRWTHFYGFPFMVTVLTLAVVWVNLFQSSLESKKKS